VALTTPEQDIAGDSVPGNRLDCWKEIAAYLGRSEKTVRRWEVDRGLPTHRAPGAGRTAVYAYTAELDEWLTSRRAQGLDPAEGGEEAAGPAAEIETPGAGIDDTVNAGAISESSAGPADARQIAANTDLPVDRHGFRLGWKAVHVRIFAAGAVIAAAFAVALQAGSGGIPRRISSMFGAAEAASVHSDSSPVSDEKKARAHELYLKGRYEWGQRTPDSLNRALDDFTQAIVQDPMDAKSYVGLADTYNLLQIYSTLPLADSNPRAIAAAKRALALDDSLAEAHRALAFSEFYGLGDWRASESEFLRAIQLDPKDPVTRRWYAEAFGQPGRYEEALEQFDKAQELDPSSHSTLSDKGIALYDSGRREEGIALLEDVERTNPEFFSPHLYLMLISFDSHDFRTFLDEGQKAAETRNDPVQKDVIASARNGYIIGGQSGLLKSLYTKQKGYYEIGKYSPAMFAMTCVALGKRQEALDVLEAAYTRHQPDALWTMAEPTLATLKDEPRYQALVKKIDFPATPRLAPTSSVPNSAVAQRRPAPDKPGGQVWP
jgi:tetratricopeptide (TPR) repeat protein